jgi:uncharacterized protein YceH (UPF0502 family)
MSLKIVLSAAEARVIGCLLEKQVTTPDQYPLSLNALTNACNQKSNRDPLMSLGETEVQQLIDALVRKHVIMERSGFGSRVPKYQHCYCNTEFSGLRFSPQELAIVCELLLRGPQTPGELRTRAARMADFADSTECERVLEGLAGRAEGAVVQRLPRQPGRREARYAHLLSGELAAALTAEAATTPAAHSAAAHAAPATDMRLAELEAEVRALRTELAELRAGLAELRAQ